MNKAYTRIVWQNEPSIETPLNETNLNKIDVALNEVDNRVVNFDTTKANQTDMATAQNNISNLSSTKANQSDLNTTNSNVASLGTTKANQSDLLISLKDVTFNTVTGLFTFTWHNGYTRTFDLNIEKIPVSFSMSAAGVITMTTADGTTFTADVASLIKTYSFNDSDQIDFTVTTDANGNKTVTAIVKDGSITESKLQPNFLADCRNAKNSASSSSLQSEGYALGTQNGAAVGPGSVYYENNAKYYSEKANVTSLAGMSDVNVSDRSKNDLLEYDGTKWKNSNRINNKIEFMNKYGIENLISSPYYSDPLIEHQKTTYTVNPDGTVLVNRPEANDKDSGFLLINYNGARLEPNTTYILTDGRESTSGSAVWVQLIRYDEENKTYDWTVTTYNGPAKFTTGNSNLLTYGVRITVYRNMTVNNQLIKPMLQKVNVDGSYSNDYVCGRVNSLLETSEELAEINENGSYNIIPYPPFYPTSNYDGLSYRVMEDGSIYVNGTAEVNSKFYLTWINPVVFLEKGKSYFMTLGKNVKGVAFYVAFYKDDTYSGQWAGYYHGYKEAIFTVPRELDYNRAAIYIEILAGTKLNETFYPIVSEVKNNVSLKKYIRGSVYSNLELTSKVGTVALTTTAQNLAGAINEHESNITTLDSDVRTLKTKVGTGALDTTSQNLVAAINELKAKFDAAIKLRGSWQKTISGNDRFAYDTGITVNANDVVIADHSDDGDDSSWYYYTGSNNHYYIGGSNCNAVRIVVYVLGN